MTGVTELLRQSWRILIKNFGKFLIISSLSGIVSIVSGGIVAAIGIFSLIPVFTGNAALTPIRYIPLAIGLIIFIGIVAYMQSWATLTLIYFVRSLTQSTSITVSAAFSATRKLVIRSWWLSLVTLLAVIGGYSLLFVPGLIFQVWFSFALFVLADQNIGSFSALQTSKNFTSGQFFPVFKRLFALFLLLAAIWLAASLIALIPVLGDLVSLLLPLFTAPLALIYTYLLYLDLKNQPREVSASHPSPYFGIVSLLGLAVSVFVIFGLLSLIRTGITHAPAIIQTIGKYSPQLQ